MKSRKQLLQDRDKCINATIEHNGNNIDNNRSRLASIVTNTTDIDQCSNFLDKVREDIIFKIKDTQVNKFNTLFRKHSNNQSNQNNQMHTRVVGDRNNGNDNNNQSQVENNNHNKWVIN